MLDRAGARKSNRASYSAMSLQMTQFKQPVGDLAGVLTTAEACFESWRSSTLSDRGSVVAAAAAALYRRREEFVRLLSIERVEHIDCSAADVDLSVDILDYYAKCASGLCAENHLTPMFREKRLGCEVHSVILHVLPSRFPYFSLARFVALNLTIGNLVVLTHAEEVPSCALAFEHLWLEAGAPVGAFTNVAAGDRSALLCGGGTGGQEMLPSIAVGDRPPYSDALRHSA